MSNHYEWVPENALFVLIRDTYLSRYSLRVFRIQKGQVV